MKYIVRNIAWFYYAFITYFTKCSPASLSGLLRIKEQNIEETTRNIFYAENSS